jgi:Domain of unknown function (DUF1707)
MAARPELRIGDADREAAAAGLREHYAQGRLSLAEFNERIDAVFAATTQGDLDHVTRDLPHVRVPSTPLPNAGIRAVGPGAGYRGGSRGGRRGAGTRLGMVLSLVSIMAFWGIVLASLLLLRFPWPGKFSVIFAGFVIIRSLFRKIFGGRLAARSGWGGGSGGGYGQHYRGHWRAHHESWQAAGGRGPHRHHGHQHHGRRHDGPEGHGRDSRPW